MILVNTIIYLNKKTINFPNIFSLIIVMLLFILGQPIVNAEKQEPEAIIIDSKAEYDSLMKFNRVDIPTDNTSYLYGITSEDSLRCMNTLIKDINSLVSNLKSSKFGISIYSINQDKYIYRKNSDKALTPASNTKLITSFCAFDAFGTDYGVRTEIITDDPDIRDSIVNGNLVLIGYGDALLSVSNIEQLADNIASLGIKKVTGNIYADGAYYDTVTNRWKYSGDKDEVERVSPITALSINRNKATIVGTSGNKTGQPLHIQIIPNSETFELTNTAVVKKVKRRRSMKVTTKKNAETNRQRFYVRGYLYPNRTYSYLHYIMQPELAVAGCLKDRLISGGVAVEGKVLDYSEYVKKSENFCEQYTLTYIAKNISQYLIPLNQNSDNYLAESMFKMLGAYSGKSDNCAEGAKKYEKELLASYEIPFEKCVVYDGSGLSRRNLLTTHTLTELLISAFYSDFYVEFLETLSLAGKYGTLEKRMKMSAAYNNLRAKTGTLKNASALSGYVTSLDGELFAFSIIFNGYGIGTYKNIENKIGVLLSEFFYYNRNISE